MATEFKTPPGRLVYGSVFTPQPVKNDDGTPKLDKDGKQMLEYAFGLAIAKNDPAWPAFYAQLKAADAAEWPTLHNPQTKMINPGVAFADKITDGDGYDKKGNLRSQKEGYGGHWILNLSSQFPVTAHVHDGRRWNQVTDPNAIKRGYYIQVTGSTQSNKSTQSPGMYRNPQMVALMGYGPEIVGQQGDPNQAFGDAPPQPPAGASATPVGPVGAPPPVAPAPAPVAPPATQAPPPPYGGYYQQPGAPVAPPPPAPPAKKLKAGVPGTYEAYIAANWTDIQLIQAGLMDDEIPF